MSRERKEQPPLVIEPLLGGWAHVTWREVEADLRFEHGDQPFTVKAVELRVRAPWLGRHRDLPIGRIESAAHANALVRFDLHKSIGDGNEGEDPAQMLEFKKAIQRGVSPRTDALVRFEFEKSIQQGGSGRIKLERFKLERPTGRRLDDDFYDSVARAYAAAVAWGMNPRKTLAADSGIPADTVARWIREARKRGKLSPAEPGKASGVVVEIPTPGGAVAGGIPPTEVVGG